MDSSRHNLHGLPPTYLAHLKALLHQWLTQQTTPAGDSKLWSEKRVAQIERAIWEGAVLTSAERGSRRESGILEQNWEGWIGGSTKRKSLWKEETRQEEEKIKEDEKTEAHVSRKSSMGDRDRGRLRLMVAQAGSTASTPSNASPRASNGVASSAPLMGMNLYHWPKQTVGKISIPIEYPSPHINISQAHSLSQASLLNTATL